MLKRRQTDEDVEWQDVTDFRAEYVGEPEHRDTVRKGSKIFYEYLNAGWINEPEPEPELSTSLSKARDFVGEEYLLRRQAQNDRLLINRFKRDMVKSISVAEELAEYQKENDFTVLVPDYAKEEKNFNGRSYSMICNISDWHIGYKINNCHGNYYNWQIANNRIDQYIDECLKYLEHYPVSKIYVINTGDSIEQAYLRDTQSDSCEFNQSMQINNCIHLIFRLLVTLSEHANVVYGGIAGNHDRMSGDKKKNLDGDNANVIITEQLKTYVELSEAKAIKILDTQYDDSEIVLNINGLNCKFVHGHEIPKVDTNTLSNLISRDNEFFDLLFTGHWHNFTSKYENNGRYVITTGCLSGFNDYSRAFYCSTKASQTICILGDKNVELIKNVELD